MTDNFEALKKIFLFHTNMPNVHRNDDGSLDLYGNLNIVNNNKLIKELEQANVEIQNMYGSFVIHKCEIESLSFMPKRIHGKVEIVQCILDALDGFSHEVNGPINLSHNNLKSLKGICEVVRGDLILNHNHLENLEFLPKQIFGTLNIQYNKITDLTSDSLITSFVQAKENPFRSINEKFKYDVNILLANELDGISFLKLYLNLLENQEVDFQDLPMVSADTHEEALFQLNEKIKIASLMNQ
jgi:hypothetical protein